MTARGKITADASRDTRAARFDTDDVPAGEREALVGDVLCKGAVPLEIEHLARESRGIELRISAVQLGPLNLQSLRSSAMAFKRTPRLVREGSPPTVALAVHRAGLTTVFQDGRRAVLGAGDLSLTSSVQPSVVLTAHQSSTDVLQIPLELLAVPKAALRQVLALRLSPELPIAGVIGRFVNDLAPVPELQPDEAEQLARPTVELLRALIATVVGDSRGAHRSLEATLQVRVGDYLRAHWKELDLTADRVAAAHHISTRQLYRLLAAQPGCTAEYLIYLG